MKITADFKNIIGKIKPMHATGQPPLYYWDTSYFHYLTDAGIPQCRLHDTGGAYARSQFVDIPNIFRDFSRGFCDFMFKIGHFFAGFKKSLHFTRRYDYVLYSQLDFCTSGVILRVRPQAAWHPKNLVARPFTSAPRCLYGEV